ncbi:hypothetical protein DdX_13432 [Ditylenchus destructor]|uniref:F-box domain-containing protein n=1 Tax=Ditylenchus destructor TaxID=166010 RepID=A0AAD4MYT2_9BILA|nr:hypothetical protein DdX_13432 [Ditylenchus destructor]
MNIPFGILRDILAVFDRRELIILSDTTRRFNGIIAKQFPTSPYLVFPFLNYSDDNKWFWSADVTILNFEDEYQDKLTQALSKKQIAQMRSSKFLRFTETCFVADRNPVEMLSPISHVWENGILWIISNRYLRSLEFVTMVKTSHVLGLEIPGALRMLPHLLQSQCHHVAVYDMANNPARKLPLLDIVNFLFHPNHSEDVDCSYFPIRYLHISIRFPLKRQFYDEIFHSVKQKFLSTLNQTNFLLRITHKKALNWTQAEDFNLDHPLSSKKLCFRILNGKSLTLSSLSDQYLFLLNNIIE